jgi:hypothetical protein
MIRPPAVLCAKKAAHIFASTQRESDAPPMTTCPLCVALFCFCSPLLCPPLSLSICRFAALCHEEILTHLHVHLLRIDA